MKKLSLHYDGMERHGFRSILSLIFILLFASLSLTGCFGGGGGVTAPNDLSALPIINRAADPAKITTLSTGVDVVMSDLLVVTDESVTEEQAIALFQKYSAIIVGRIPEAYLYQIGIPSATTEATLTQVRDALANETGVVQVSFNYMGKADSSSSWLPTGGEWENQKWAMEKINAPTAWKYIGGSFPAPSYIPFLREVKVGVIDSGFDSDNGDISFDALFSSDGTRDNYLARPLGISSFNAYSDIATYHDAWGEFNHGMNVAGVIAANGNNHIGTVGVAWQAPIKLYAARHDGSAMSILAHVARLVKDGEKVINISVGLTKPDILVAKESAMMFSSLIDSLLKKQDFLLVFAAGNESDFADKSAFMGFIFRDSWGDYNLQKYKNIRDHVLNVGAVGRKEFAPYSNYGRSVEILASGGDETCINDIKSPPFDPPVLYEQNSPFYSSCFRKGIVSLGMGVGVTTMMHGTSQAAPHVTGAAALMWSLNPSLTAKQVKELLISSATERVERVAGESYPLLNLYEAVKAANKISGNASPDVQTPSSTIITSILCHTKGDANPIADVPITITPATAPSENVGGTQDKTNTFGIHIAELDNGLIDYYKTAVFTLRISKTVNNPEIIKSFKIPLALSNYVRSINVNLWSKDGGKCSGSGVNLETVITASDLTFVNETADSDSDGMPDIWELQYGLDSNNPADAAQDKDGDGVNNLDEFKENSDPTDKTKFPDDVTKLFNIELSQFGDSDIPSYSTFMLDGIGMNSTDHEWDGRVWNIGVNTNSHMLLTSTGWVSVPKGEPSIVEADASAANTKLLADVTDANGTVVENYSMTSKRLSAGSLKMADILPENTWKTYLQDTSETFPADSNVYEINTMSITSTYVTSGDSDSFINIGGSRATNLNELLVSGSTTNDKVFCYAADTPTFWKCVRLNGNTGNASGSVTVLRLSEENGSSSVIGSATWVRKTVNNVEMIEVNLPSNLRQGGRTPFFAYLNQNVVQGEFTPAETQLSPTYFMDTAAKTAVLQATSAKLPSPASVTGFAVQGFNSLISVNQPVTIKIFITGLTKTAIIAIQDAECNAPYGYTLTHFYQECTPRSIGSKTLIVKDKSGGNILYSGTVQVNP